MLDKKNVGRPPVFNSPEQLEGLFMEYIDHCEVKQFMPNISGFCTWMRRIKLISVHRDTYYEYAKKEGYSDIIKGINDAIEDGVLNCKCQKDLLKIAYLNNKCGYTQKQQIEQHNFNYDESNLTNEQIQELNVLMNENPELAKSKFIEYVHNNNNKSIN